MLNNVLSRLEDLNQQSSYLLENGTLNPSEINEFSALTLDALQDARPMIDQLNDEGIIPNLRAAINKAEQNKYALDELWKCWQPIRKQLDQVSTKQDDLDKLADLQGLRPVNEAKANLDSLKVIF